jgi:hypothetical protein
MAEDAQLIMERAAAQADRWAETVARQREIITRLADGMTIENVVKHTVTEVVELRLRVKALEAAARPLGVPLPVADVAARQEAEALVYPPQSRAYGMGRKS